MTEGPRGTGTARDFMPPTDELPVLRDAAQHCQGCGLYAFATQAIFGEGPDRAEVMLVGEQPGDKEDLAGHPFVGQPASFSIAHWSPQASIGEPST